MITTFEQRQFQNCLPLVKSIRRSGISLPVTVIINGNLGSEHDHGARTEFVKSLMALTDVNVIGLGTINSLARMWNLGIQVSNYETTIVLNDDLAISGSEVREDFETLAKVASVHHLARGGIGWGAGFSHFAITQSCIERIGWFDERFVGFGEEDHDYIWRYENYFGTKPQYVLLRGVTNLDDPSTSGHVGVDGGKYALSCDVFRSMKYLPGKGSIYGPFSNPTERVIDEIDSYPTWAIHMSASELLKMTDREELKSRLSLWLGPATST